MLVLSRAEVQHQCQHGGKQWVIVDNTIIDVKDLLHDGDGAHKGGDVFSIGRDNTHLFRELHANLPTMPSKHRPDLPSITSHILEKVQKNVIGVLKGCEGDVPLSDPRHRFWEPTTRKPPYMDETTTSILATQGEQAAAAEVERAVAGLCPNSPEYRAFWAVIGSLVADAAAQPTHWNYKVTYYQDELRGRGRWDTPEFMRPTMNQYYRVPCGSQSCFGDQAATVLRSLAHSHGAVDVQDLIQRHVEKFGPRGEYGALGRHDGASAGALPILGPWRHGSVAGFLKNVAQGAPYPRCGTRDGSSDCFVKVVPVVARYAGEPQLLDRVVEVVRVTQNNHLTVAYACAAARVLEQIILHGVTGEEAVERAAGAMARRRGGLPEDEEIAEEMAAAMELRRLPYLEAVRAFCGGRYNAVAVS